MDDQAWPFLIGRTRDQDHRMVVIPDFMAAAALAGALRLSAGSGAPGSPESVQIREIQTSPKDRVTVIYRVGQAHAGCWGLPGEQALTDEQGRPIVLTEGLVIRRPATVVRQAGITEEDLDLAHSLVVPAYLEFWAQGRDYTRQHAESFRLAASGKPVAVTPPDSAIPTVITHQEATHPPAPAAPAGTQQPKGITDGTYAPVPAGSAALAAPGGRRSRKKTATAAAIGVAVAVITIGVLLATRLLNGPGPAAPASGPARTMAALCNALQSGDPVRGYATTTSTYQHETTEQKFAAELLPSGKTSAIRCSYRLQANPGPATASATMTLTYAHQAHSWQVTLTKANQSTWQVSTIR